MGTSTAMECKGFGGLGVRWSQEIGCRSWGRVWDFRILALGFSVRVWDYNFRVFVFFSMPLFGVEGFLLDFITDISDTVRPCWGGQGPILWAKDHQAAASPEQTLTWASCNMDRTSSL